MKSLLLVVATLFTGLSLFGQVDNSAGLPFIQNYTAKDYNAHEQNWSIAQDRQGIMYFGNSNGLLEYDGVNWRFIDTESPDIVRSVCVSENGVVYIGGHDYFGYLERDSVGNHIYVSLSDRLKPEDGNFRDVWQTFSTAGGIFFKTNKALFLYAGDSLRSWQADTRFHVSFLMGDKLYIRQYEMGLMRLNGDKLELLKRGEFYADKRVYAMFPYAGDTILIATREHGLFLYDGEDSTPYRSEAADYLNKNTLITGTMTPNGNFAFATRSGGVLIMDRMGKIVQIINKNKGILNNNVWNLYYDKQGGLWLALDNGISRVQFPSPLTFFGENSGLPGGIEFITRHDNILYIATHKGLYAMIENGNNNGRIEFKNMYRLKTYIGEMATLKEGLYFADEDNGTFEIKNRKIRLVSNLTPYSILASRIHKNLLYLGLPDGVSFLRKKNGKWTSPGKLKLGLGPIRFIAETEKGDLWLGTSKNVICRLNYTFTPEGESGLLNPEIELYDHQHGLPVSDQYWVFTYGNEPHFGTYDGLYHFDDARNIFVRDTLMCKPFGTEKRSVQRIVEGKDGAAWMWTVTKNRNELGVMKKNGRGGFIWEYVPFLPLKDLVIYAIYPDPLLPDVVWFGGPDGLVKYDMSINKDYNKPFPALVRRVTAGEDSLIYAGNENRDPQTKNGPTRTILDYRYNALHFEFSVPSYDNEKENTYQYFLEGYDNKWSQWTNETKIFYRNIPEGRYRLRVKAKNIYDIQSSEGHFTFEVLPPLYRAWWAYMLYGIFMIGAIFSLLKLRSFQLEKEKAELEKIVHERTDEIQSKNILLAEQAEKLLELDEIKSRFFTNISHEFRTPLTMIIGPSEEGMKKDYKGNARKAFETIRRNANRLLRLINQLLDLSKLESGKMELRASLQPLSPFLKTIVANFSSLAESRNIYLQFLKPEKDHDIYFDPDKLEKVMLNLLSNAFKFTPENGFIIVSVFDCDEAPDYPKGAVEISVHDTGMGIDKKHLPFVFDRFNQGDNVESPRFGGSGIGLALSKELVELHHGEIKIASSPGEGTELDVILPLGRDHLQQNEIVGIIKEERTRRSSLRIDDTVEFRIDSKEESDPDAQYEGDKYHILIVEDNAELRKYVKDHFAADYHIFEARDGIEGCDLAREHLPDLIISDVMMPEMDGFELTQQLKRDEKTSHIPIILLTAKASDADKIVGLETGADSYVTKPFNVTELEVRVKKLIESRQELRRKFKKDFLTEPADIKVSSLDDQFVKKARDIIEEQMSDSDFGVDELQRHFPMSQRQFFLKVKALTDHTPGHFIRIMRLKRAMDLIRQDGGSISEIAYAVGFNNLSYFAKCFRTTFGKLPSEV